MQDKWYRLYPIRFHTFAGPNFLRRAQGCMGQGNEGELGLLLTRVALVPAQ